MEAKNEVTPTPELPKALTADFKSAIARRGVWVMLIACVFAHAETWYFGWNLTAKSDAERVCDGIALTAYGLGFAMWLIGRAVEELAQALRLAGKGGSQ